MTHALRWGRVSRRGGLSAVRFWHKRENCAKAAHRRQNRHAAMVRSFEGGDKMPQACPDGGHSGPDLCRGHGG